MKAVPQKCHACEVIFAGTNCPGCGAERPAFTALKKISAEASAPRCRIYITKRCDCGQRALCLEAA